MDVYDRARSEGFKSIDSAHLMNTYGKDLYMVKSSRNNIKITEPPTTTCSGSYAKQASQQVFGI